MEQTSGRPSFGRVSRERHYDAPTSPHTSSYVSAAAAVALALLARYALQHELGLEVAHLLFYPAVVFAAWLGGLGPGVFATTLSGLAAMYWLLPPDGLAVASRTDQLSLGVFILTGAAIAALNGRLHRTRDALRVEVAAAAARAERLDTILSTTVDGVIVIDTLGRIEAFNRGAERLFGHSERDVLGRNVSVLMPSPHREEHDTYVASYLTTGKAKIIGLGREVQALHSDGTTFPVHLSVGEMTAPGERKFVGILHDLTKRVRMEQQLREQTTLARLGEMAAVLAHEVENPLAGIRGAIQVVGTRLPPDNASGPILKEIVSRIDSLDAMMKDLLLFARPPTPRLRPTDVTPVLTTTAALLGQDPGMRDLAIDVEGSAPPVAADADMLKIVFQNLLINGAHAMQGKGRIRVVVSVEDATCRISFADTGPGIPPAVREKLFTPFFTTKSRGTGLGLPTVKRLVDAHGGEVTVDCPPGGGTTVVVSLPLAHQAPATGGAADA